MGKVDFQGYSDKDIESKITEEKELLKKLKFSNIVSTVENPMKIRATRRSIAQLKTELRKRELNSVNNTEEN